jgi:cobalt-zinc-cadmium efflux system protein
MTSAENRHEGREGHGHDHDAHEDHDHDAHDHDHEDHDHDHEDHDHDDHDHGGHESHDDHSGHDHHGHAHDRAAVLREASRRSLIIALFLLGGIFSGSLALLADAGHMLTDATSISLALVAVWIAGRPESLERTFGYQRTEVLAAAFNALSLWVIAGWIVWEAVERLLNHHTMEIEGGLMLIVGAIGLGVNIVAAFVLHAGSKHSLNVDGAFKHVLADLMGSVGVVISGLIVIFTGWVLIDPILSLGIALLIVVSSWRLVLRSVNVLLGGVPEHVDLYALCADIEEVEGVTLIHDVHVFTVTSNFDFMAAHILVDPRFQGDTNELLGQLRQIASEKHRIHHVTLQLCHSATECSENHHAGHLEAISRPAG